MLRRPLSPSASVLPDRRTRSGSRVPANGERPFTARSVIASTLLGTHPPRLSSSRLVRACELFEISESTARVALSRMVAKGELAVADGRYMLLGKLLERQSRQRWSRSVTTRDWDGTWIVEVAHANARTAVERSDLRLAMRRLRFGEVRDGAWLRPDNLVGDADSWSTSIVAPQCVAFCGARPNESRRLAAQLFPLHQWAPAARSLVADLDRWQPALDRGDADALPVTFTLNAAVVRHLQNDPLLPDELLPRAWPGDRLRSRFESFDAAFVALWRAAIRS